MLSFKFRETMESAATGLYIFSKNGDRLSLAKPIPPLVFEDLGAGAVYYGDKPATILIPYEAMLNKVLDELVVAMVKAGLRPSEERQAGELTGALRHIEDLSAVCRTLAGAPGRRA